MKFAKIPLKKIRIAKKQVRRSFDEERLRQLASSMQEIGQLQPVIVKLQGDGYLLIVGERRFRAIKKTAQTWIDAVILEQDINESMLRQIQLVENLQREDLNPLERAFSIQKFMKENKLNKKEASKKLGVPRTTLTEWLNILEVAKQYQQAVIDEDSPLSLSHISLAKALVSRTGDPTKLKQLLNGVLKYNLTRNETKQITEIYHKYLHISMEEAIAAILLKREQQKKIFTKNITNKKGLKNNYFNKLIKSFGQISKDLEEIMEEVGVLDQKENEELIDEFLYVYQLIEIMIPEIRTKGIEKMITEIKERNR